jgi:hypothetical protein
MTLSPPMPQWLWDIITGGAPVNEYSILGVGFLMLGYAIYGFIIIIGIFLFYWIINYMEEFVGTDRKKRE